MPDEERRPVARPKVKQTHTAGVGNMEPGARAMRRVRSVGRNSSRVYCEKCGFKKVNGQCPRHPA